MGGVSPGTGLGSVNSNIIRQSLSSRDSQPLGQRDTQGGHKHHHQSVQGPEEGGGSSAEDVASALRFNEVKSLVDEEGEGHCS